jgi:hypothetical protein
MIVKKAVAIRSINLIDSSGHKGETTRNFNPGHLRFADRCVGYFGLILATKSSLPLGFHSVGVDIVARVIVFVEQAGLANDHRSHTTTSITAGSASQEQLST